MAKASNNFTFKDNSKLAKALFQQAAVLGLEKAANLVEGRSKARTPVQYGQLRDTQGHLIEVTRGNPEATVGSPLKYAIYVEKGTGEFATNGQGRKGGWSYKDEKGTWHRTNGQKPQPFLEPAFKSSTKEIKQLVGDGYKIKLKKKGG